MLVVLFFCWNIIDSSACHCFQIVSNVLICNLLLMSTVFDHFFQQVCGNLIQQLPYTDSLLSLCFLKKVCSSVIIQLIDMLTVLSLSGYVLLSYQCT